MFSIHDEEKLRKILEENHEKKFRYSQIENAIYKNFIVDFNKISNISKKTIELLNENCFYTSLKVKSEFTSKDGQTTRLIFETFDKCLIEAVMIRHLSGRNTLCISSQIGCSMNCSFCATGKLKLTRNLEFYEIVDQIMEASLIFNNEGRKLRNVVYMGMGEPFLNYDNVKKSIEIACKKEKLDFSVRRVTISTCGIIPGIKVFAQDFPQTSLAISLHAPNSELRKSLMPVENTHPLKELLGAIDEYIKTTNKKVFLEYVMIKGINDTPKEAHELIEISKNRLVHINLIPYNPGELASKTKYEPSTTTTIKKFQDILKNAGLITTVRHKMGDDIDAACGQLATVKDS